MSMILTLDAGGNPHRWSTWQDAIIYKTKGLVSWSAGEVEFKFTGGKSRKTGETSSIIVPSIIALKNKSHQKYRAPILTNRNLFRRDLFVCAYCGNKYADHKLTRDHIQPQSKGGPDTWMNCVTACWDCNNYKDDHLLKDINMSLLYVPYTPSKTENLILSNRNILADQMVFLVSYLPPESRAHRLL